MTFGEEVLAIFLGDVFATTLVVLLYVVIQWFLRATDVRIGYNWKWEGPNFHPSLHIRNQSESRSYLLGNIAYTKNNGKEILFIDNESIWGRELKPGSINLIEAGVVKNVTSLPQCTDVEVRIRLQNGREFWLKGTGPGQPYMKRMQRTLLRIREKLQRNAIPLE